ncbi:S-locus glycoprotein [Corchorus capsularis]|uniref:S-locus glycoprotein n=1 Tax=Corchorus capsularis TaxID=210143 RepID=A0A1R3I223_COCAP|nr:S-locus glycoprotein [Corchorus capsularis]
MLTPYQALSQGQTLISPGNVFELGFVSFNNYTLYVGIYYKNIVPRRVLWVANRENPITNSSSSSTTLMIADDGNLKLTNGMHGSDVVSSTKVPIQSNNNSVAVLLDNGNLVLKDNSSGEILWESFSHPGDTFLPGMRIGIMNVQTGDETFLVASKSSDDPSPGSFVGRVVTQSAPIIETFIWNGNDTHWRSGQWDGLRFVGIPQMDSVYFNGLSFISNSQDGSQYFTFDSNSLIRFWYLSPQGPLQLINWDEGSKEFVVELQVPDNQCDIYEACGPNGICNKDKSPICQCLEGFEPKSNQEWSKGNWTDGCVRRVELVCDKNNSSSSDGFLKLSGVKLPDRSQYQKPQENTGDACGFWCLNNCSCMAYSYVTGIGCIIWSGDLIDVQSFSSTGEDLFIRVARSEIGTIHIYARKKKNDIKSKVILPVVAASIAFFILCTLLAYGFFRWRVANQTGTD